MVERLQEFGYRESPYQRPTQQWVCGRLAEGCPCQIGPDDKGNCRATYECRPRREGDRWLCSRSQFAGGPCSDGPLPDGTCCREIPKCKPVRSWRAKRGAATKWVVSVAVALILVVVAGAGQSDFLNPGALTTKHAELGTCANCHTAFEKGPSGWLHAAFGSSSMVDDSRNCLSCHRLGETPFAPHSLDQATLAALTTEASEASRMEAGLIVRASNVMFPRMGAEGEPLACATCHREHHGMDWDLTQMSNVRCASCHQSQFVSFSGDHPKFTDYPYQRRTRIIFDHTSHIDKHFVEAKNVENAPKLCHDCHEPDNRGELMLVKPFEQVCGSCHGAQVAGAGRAGSKGIPVLSAPGLDVIALRDLDAAVGEWPELSDAPITPFMDFLLSQDEDFVTARKTLEGVDLLDLSDATEEQVAAIEKLAWSVKTFLFELRTRGVEAMREQLESAFDRSLSDREVNNLVALLPASAVASAQESWFPSLLTEVPRYRKGERILLPASPEDETSQGTGAQQTDVSSGSGDGSILGGNSDSGGSILGGSDDSSGSILGSDSSSGDGSSILGGDSDSGGSILGGSDDSSGSILGGDDSSGDSGGILGGASDSGGSILGGSDDSSGSILGGDSGDQGGSVLGGLTGGSDGDRSVEQEALPEPAEVADPEEWMAAGGWYTDYYVLRHRPVGHADIFVSSWIDHTAEAGKSLASARVVFEELVADKAVGLCSKCHTVDAQGETEMQVNWHARRPQANTRGFTRYKHTSHFSLMDEQGCVNCHNRNPNADYAASFQDRDPMSYTSNFVTIDQQFCASCHIPEKAGDACLICHNYHVGSFPPTVLSTQVGEMASAAEVKE